MHPDDQVLDAILNGDQSAYAEIVDRHKRFAFNIANQILRNAEEAEEAAQDAFVKAYRNLKKFDRRSKFSTWLYRIVTNEALGRARKKKYDHVDIASAFGIGQADNSTDENAFLVRSSILKLGDKDRELLTLFYLKELNLEEMGQILDQETNTVKVSVHRARKKLANMMLSEIGEEVYALIEG